MIPLRATNYKLSNKWPSNIILHSSACEHIKNISEVKYDKNSFQSDKFQLYHYAKHKTETNVHFIIEKSGNDFFVVVSQPLMTLCKYEDLDPKYYKDVHILFLGDYNLDMPMNREYDVLAYRILNPIMRTFLIDEDNILLHNVISNDKNCSCPGEFFNMARLHEAIRKIRKRVSLRRN